MDHDGFDSSKLRKYISGTINMYALRQTLYIVGTISDWYIEMILMSTSNIGLGRFP